MHPQERRRIALKSELCDDRLRELEYKGKMYPLWGCESPLPKHFIGHSYIELGYAHQSTNFLTLMFARGSPLGV